MANTGQGSTKRLRSWLLTGALLALVPNLAGQAEAAERRVRFSIQAGSLQQALVAYATATGDQLLYSTAMVAGHSAPRLVGGFSRQAALARLLAGTGLKVREVGLGVFVLEETQVGASATAASAERLAGSHAPVVDMLAGPSAPALPSGSSDGSRPTRLATQSEEDQSEIVVTGTHIRGSNPGTPPVTSITRDDLTRNGYATVAQALQALPGNFGGMATEQSSLGFADTTGSNYSLATGVNLRGLGAGATLVLVNGQRLGGSGNKGAFSDVSMIPTGAVDRIEVLMDGASAIYGSDAVGGVVNILLKRQFEGAETRMRLGSVTRGDKRDVQLGQTVGTRWASGGAMLSYEYNRAGALATVDRRFARSADSRPFGGTDHRYIFGSPGNVLGFDPVTGALGAGYAIPDGQDGTALTPDSFLAGITNLKNQRAGADLIPRQTRHSAYATIDQKIGSRVRISADARYSRRSFDARLPGAAAIVQITAANPYFVSPTGAPMDLIAYSLEPEFGPIHVHGFAEAMAYSANLDADLGADWKLRGYAAFAQERGRGTTDHTVNSASLAEAVGLVPDNPATPFNTATDGFFNPYGVGASNPAKILDFVGGGYQISRTRSRVWTGHVDADGTLATLPGGPVKLAVGGDVRREQFATNGIGYQFTVAPIDLFVANQARTVTAGFAELHVPFFGDANARPGLQRLALSIAGRIEHYAQFGTTFNPKFGVSWVPVDGVTLRSSYGTSFRAPNLRELGDAQQYSATTLSGSDGATLPVIQLSGGNPDLRPEKARSWTAGIDLSPALIPRLSVSATWFRTVFRQRIATPANDNFDNALNDPTLAPFVERVSPGSNPADLARIEALFADPAFVGGANFPASAIAAIVDTRYVNTGKVDVSGIDIAARYRIPVGANQFDLGASASYLLRYREQVTPTSGSVDQRNRVGRPVDLRGRATLGWTRGIANAQLGINHVAAYHDLAGKPINAWTTVDLEIGLTAPNKPGPMRGASIALVATNLFDKAPPFYDSPVGIGYDATNADALGRFLSLQLTKRW